MDSIFGYRIESLISETANSKIYRVKKNNNSYVLKVLKKEYPTPTEIARFKKEFNLLSELKDINVVQSVKLYDTSEGFAILEEDFNAISLKEYIQNKISIKRFLEIAINVSKTLGEMHKNNIIHKDIKPANILINDKNNIIKIADLGIAAIASEKEEHIFTNEAIQGTLVYMSPEQTGRMNRDVDYRTDLYSLGITFYEMLVNSLPFSSNDPLEIIHSHIARTPKPVSELQPDIPETISHIINKLMAKTAEERYQNAFGLMYDLEECLDQLKSSGDIQNFDLGKKDVSLRFNIPQVLVGREREVETLLKSFESFCNGKRNSILVTGQPGIGKSALINEIQKPIVERRGFFLRGKFDQLRKDTPYSAVIQAFKFLINLILIERPDHIQVFKEQLTNVLGENGKLITDIIPDVEVLIGEQAPVEKLGHDEALNRFNFVFKNFVNVFASPDHPIVLFIDDLQWMDLASLSLLQYLITDIEIKNLFFIGAYRDNEISHDHPLKGFISEIQKEKVAIQKLKVRPLAEKDIFELLTKVFHDNNQRINDLSNLIFSKTEGNPFFLIQFLKNLYDEKLIMPDSAVGWTWNLEQLKSKQVTDNVVEMMVKKINNLPQGTSHILKVCACTGNRFDLGMLSEATEIQIDQVLNDLSPAIEIGLISEMEGIYRFHHDRIEEAAYSMIPDDVKVKLHYKIGSIVLRGTEDDDIVNKIFYILHHLNRAIPLIESFEEKIKLAELNKIAGDRASAASAFDSALSFYEIGNNLLPEDAWENHYEITFYLNLKIAENYFITGYPDKADKLFKNIISRAKNKLDMGNVYLIWIDLAHSMEEYEKALEYGQKAFRLFNIKFNKKPSLFAVMRSVVYFKFFMKKNPPEKVVCLDVAEKIEHQLIFNLFYPVVGVAAIYNNNLNVILSIKFYKLASRVGNSKYSTSMFILLGTIFIVGLNDFTTGKRFWDAAKISRDKFNVGSDVFPFFLQEYFISHWFYPLRKSIENFRIAHNALRNNGNIIYANHSISNLLHLSIVAGRQIDETFEEFKRYKDFIFKLKDPSAEKHYYDHLRFYENLKGKTDSIHTLNKSDSYEENTEVHIKNSSRITKFLYYMLKARLDYIYGNYGKAYEYSEVLKDCISEFKGTFHDSDFCFFQSIIMSSYYDEANSKEKKIIKKQLNKNVKKLVEFNEYCEENNSHRLELVLAEIKRVNGDFKAAESLYLESIKLAAEQQFLQNEAIASELLMKLYFTNGRYKKAVEFFKKTVYLFSRWGASAKVDYLKIQYPDLVTEIFESGAETGGDTITSTYSRTGTTSFDFSSSLKASEAISREIVLPDLLKKIMHVVQENAGAQKGFLILETNGSYAIEARSTVDSGEVVVLESTPVEKSDELPLSLIQFVIRKGEHVILANAAEDQVYSNDKYIKNNKIKSILCFPVLNQGKISGILYLENKLNANAFTPDRIELLTLISSQAAVSIDNARLYANLEEKVEERTTELREARDALWGEMRLAAKIQTVLLPEKPVISGYQVVGHMVPADEVGGDYYDVINGDGVDWVVIGDVSGHGVTSGLVMMMVQTTIQAQVRHNSDMSPSQVLEIINRAIAYNISQMKQDKYMTITLFKLYPDGRVVYSGLHQDIMIYRASKDDVESIRSDGMWIGMISDINGMNHDQEFKINRGDSILLFTDGITEAWEKGSVKEQRDPATQMFGEERLVEVLKKSGKGSPEEIRDAVVSAVSNYEVDDDETMLILKKV